jgi:hypothetical protein
VVLQLGDDFVRARVTVFFRLLLAIPPLVWFFLWTIAALVAAVLGWFATVVTGRLPDGLHSFLAAYVRYGIRVRAYLFLAAEPWPGFSTAEQYPVDVEIAPPGQQRRATALFRLALAIPAIGLSAILGPSLGFQAGAGRRYGTRLSATGIASTAAFFGWFASLWRGQMPRDLRNLIAYTLDYSAQAAAYTLLLTDRYPNSDPTLSAAAERGTEHPVRLTVADDGRRSRLTVFFRALLVLPHLVWLALWSIAVLFASIANWLATLVRGESPGQLHRFVAAWLRYSTHVSAYLDLVANPFPAFNGAEGVYPLDPHVADRQPQNRWKTAFRILLAIPALAIGSALGAAVGVAAFYGWFTGLAVGRMPTGLRNLGAYGLRYQAQAFAYLLLLTDRYPSASPLQEEGAEKPFEPVQLALE